MPLTVPVFSKTPNLIKELVKRVPNVTFHEVLSPDSDKYFKKSDVLICDFDYLGPHLYNLPETKWVQGTWAGVDALTKYIDKNRTIPYQITRFTGQHFGRIMGEYVFSNIVNFERSFFKVKANQKNSEWNRDGKINSYRTIYDLTVGIMGFGNIGSRIAKLLDFSGARVLALVRQPKSNIEFPYVSNFYTQSQLKSFLEECDYVVNVLPNVPGTDNLLDGGILENCKDKRSVLINIGRGNIITENSLVEALEKNWISGAILDVFAVEPLPKESKLWSLPQVFITPHVAGSSRAPDIAEQFRENYELYLRNQPLPGRIDFTKGY